MRVARGRHRGRGPAADARERAHPKFHQGHEGSRPFGQPEGGDEGEHQRYAENQQDFAAEGAIQSYDEGKRQSFYDESPSAEEADQSSARMKGGLDQAGRAGRAVLP